MPDDDDVDVDHSAMLRSYAKSVLYSMFDDNPKGNKECEDLIRDNADNVKRMFRFEDRRPKKTNKCLNKGISMKTPIFALLSKVKNEGI